jgi:hypothetical protein
MDNKALLALWNTEVMLAHAFLISCGDGVNPLRTEEPEDRISDMNACYMAWWSTASTATVVTRFDV